MSKDIYIKDDFGNQIPMLDSYGNLSIEVVMLYSEDKLTTEDRKAVADFAATDEMSKDALEGYALTSNSSKTRFNLGQVNSEIQKISGAKPISSLSPAKEEFDYRKLAAAVALLVVIGGTTFFASQYFSHNELAEGTSEKKKETQPIIPKIEQAIDPLIDTSDSNSTEDVAPVLTLPLESQSDVSEDFKAKEPANEASEELAIEDIENEAESTDLEDPDLKISKLPSGSQGIVAVSNGTEPEEEKLEMVVIEEDKSNNINDAAAASIAQEQARTAAESKRMEVAKKESELAELVVLEKQRKAEESNRAGDEFGSRKAKEQQASAELDQMVEEVSEERNTSNSESSAIYPGGDLEMYKFIENEKRYTDEMRDNNLSGSVIVLFQIDKDGSVIKPEIKSGAGSVLNEDALRVVRAMPKWSPAKRPNGNPVKSARTVVIRYSPED